MVEIITAELMAVFVFSLLPVTVTLFLVWLIAISTAASSEEDGGRGGERGFSADPFGPAGRSVRSVLAGRADLARSA